MPAEPQARGRDSTRDLDRGRRHRGAVELGHRPESSRCYARPVQCSQGPPCGRGGFCHFWRSRCAALHPARTCGARRFRRPQVRGADPQLVLTQMGMQRSRSFDEAIGVSLPGGRGGGGAIRFARPAFVGGDLGDEAPVAGCQRTRSSLVSQSPCGEGSRWSGRVLAPLLGIGSKHPYFYSGESSTTLRAAVTRIVHWHLGQSRVNGTSGTPTAAGNVVRSRP
jgi:hypothetical protein